MLKSMCLGHRPMKSCIKKYNPSTKEPETYHMAAMNQYVEIGYASAGSPTLKHHLMNSFTSSCQSRSRCLSFQQHYWGEDARFRGKESVMAAHRCELA